MAYSGLRAKICEHGIFGVIEHFWELRGSSVFIHDLWSAKLENEIEKNLWREIRKDADLKKQVAEYVNYKGKL